MLLTFTVTGLNVSVAVQQKNINKCNFDLHETIALIFWSHLEWGLILQGELFLRLWDGQILL